MKATEIKEKHFRMLLMAPYGAGKTYLVGLIHEMLKKQGNKGVYLFDFDAGVQTLSSAGFDVEFDFYTDNKSDLTTGFERFQSKYNAIEANTDGLGCIAIDSLSTLQKSSMKYVHRINKTKRQLGFLSSRNDYGVQIDILTQMFPQFLALSKRMNIIMTCHTREREKEAPVVIGNTENDGEPPARTIEAVEILPAVVGRSLPSQIGMWFNEVWYLRSESNAAFTSRKVQTASGDNVHCKTQIAKMPYLCTIEEALKMLASAYDLLPKKAEEVKK